MSDHALVKINVAGYRVLRNRLFSYSINRKEVSQVEESEWQDELLQALEECKTAFTRIAEFAPGDDAFLWTLSELMKHIAAMTWPLKERPW